MTINELWKVINKFCPQELAEEWDNSGPQIMIANKEIKTVLVALEVTQDIINEAISLKADAIITHHPLFFGGFNQITEETLPTKYSIQLIKNDISVISCHTNFDSMKGGNNDYLGKLLGFRKIVSHGIYRSGELSSKSTIKDIINHISSNLKIDKKKIRLIGNLNDRVKTVCWCTGAGGDYIMDGYDLKADLYISGDIKYHDARTALEFGINVLDIGHFGSEKIFTPNMAALLKKNLSKKGIKVIETKLDIDPYL